MADVVDTAFTCSFEGCGRSFSVLSNMRRHARVHSSMSHPVEDSSDEDSDEHRDVSVAPPSPPADTARLSPYTTAPRLEPSIALNPFERRRGETSASRIHSRPASASSGDTRQEKRIRR